MYLEEVNLKRIAPFEDISLNFTSESGNLSKWIVLLGENGTGKTTILQMIALSLLGREMLSDVVQGVEWHRYIRAPHKKGDVTLTLLSTKDDSKRNKSSGDYKNKYVTRFELGSTIRLGLRQDTEKYKVDAQRLDQTLYSEKIDVGWFACGYGSWRRLPQYAKTPSSQPIIDKKSTRFKTMFDIDTSISHVGNWLINLDYQRLKEPDNLQVKRIFDLAIDGIEKTLPKVKFDRISEDRDILFRESASSVPLERLSDGYKSTLAWVGDLIRRLVEAFPDRKNPLEAQGVVLVDELDIHLHPKWQQTVVEQIRALFPNLQFIVTSHSPFIAQDMQSEDKIFVLKKEDSSVKVIEGLDNISGWQADQISTSIDEIIQITNENVGVQDFEPFHNKTL